VPLNLRQLEAFRAVIMVGSATEAAKTLGITQPGVSRLIGDLERETGFRLFERRGGRLTATVDGMLFYHEVEKHMGALESIGRVAGSIANLRRGELRITAMQAYANGLVPVAMASFLKDHGDVAVTLDGRPRGGVIEAVASGRADIGIGSQPILDAAIRCENLLTLPARVVVRADHALAAASEITPADLADIPFITFPPDSQFRLDVDNLFARSRVTRHKLIEVYSTEAACSLVAAGGGASIVVPFLSHLVNQPDLAMVPLKPAIPVTLSALLRIDRTPSRAAEAFLAVLRDTVRAMWPAEERASRSRRRAS